MSSPSSPSANPKEEQGEATQDSHGSSCVVGVGVEKPTKDSHEPSCVIHTGVEESTKDSHEPSGAINEEAIAVSLAAFTESTSEEYEILIVARSFNTFPPERIWNACYYSI